MMSGVDASRSGRVMSAAAQVQAMHSKQHDPATDIEQPVEYEEELHSTDSLTTPVRERVWGSIRSKPGQAKDRVNSPLRVLEGSMPFEEPHEANGPSTAQTSKGGLRKALLSESSLPQPMMDMYSPRPESRLSISAINLDASELSVSPCEPTTPVLSRHQVKQSVSAQRAPFTFSMRPATSIALDVYSSDLEGSAVYSEREEQDDGDGINKEPDLRRQTPRRIMQRPALHMNTGIPAPTLKIQASPRSPLSPPPPKPSRDRKPPLAARIATMKQHQQKLQSDASGDESDSTAAQPGDRYRGRSRSLSISPYADKRKARRALIDSQGTEPKQKPKAKEKRVAKPLQAREAQPSSSSSSTLTASKKQSATKRVEGTSATPGASGAGRSKTKRYVKQKVEAVHRSATQSTKTVSASKLQQTRRGSVSEIEQRLPLPRPHTCGARTSGSTSHSATKKDVPTKVKRKEQREKSRQVTASSIAKAKHSTQAKTNAPCKPTKASKTTAARAATNAKPRGTKRQVSASTLNKVKPTAKNATQNPTSATSTQAMVAASQKANPTPQEQHQQQSSCDQSDKCDSISSTSANLGVTLAWQRPNSQQSVVQKPVLRSHHLLVNQQRELQRTSRVDAYGVSVDRSTTDSFEQHIPYNVSGYERHTVLIDVDDQRLGLGVRGVKDTGYGLSVQSVSASGAASGKIYPGDIILSVNEVDTSALETQKAKRTILTQVSKVSRPGTVKFELLRSGSAAQSLRRTLTLHIQQQEQQNEQLYRMISGLGSQGALTDGASPATMLASARAQSDLHRAQLAQLVGASTLTDDVLMYDGDSSMMVEMDELSRLEKLVDTDQTLMNQTTTSVVVPLDDSTSDSTSDSTGKGASSRVLQVSPAVSPRQVLGRIERSANHPEAQLLMDTYRLKMSRQAEQVEVATRVAEYQQRHAMQFGAGADSMQGDANGDQHDASNTSINASFRRRTGTVAESGSFLLDKSGSLQKSKLKKSEDHAQHTPRALHYVVGPNGTVEEVESDVSGVSTNTTQALMWTSDTASMSMVNGYYFADGSLDGALSVQPMLSHSSSCNTSPQSMSPAVMSPVLSPRATSPARVTLPRHSRRDIARMFGSHAMKQKSETTAQTQQALCNAAPATVSADERIDDVSDDIMDTVFVDVYPEDYKHNSISQRSDSSITSSISAHSQLSMEEVEEQLMAALMSPVDGINDGDGNSPPRTSTQSVQAKDFKYKPALQQQPLCIPAYGLKALSKPRPSSMPPSTTSSAMELVNQVQSPLRVAPFPASPLAASPLTASPLQQYSQPSASPLTTRCSSSLSAPAASPLASSASVCSTSNASSEFKPLAPSPLATKSYSANQQHQKQQQCSVTRSPLLPSPLARPSPLAGSSPLASALNVARNSPLRQCTTQTILKRQPNAYAKQIYAGLQQRRHVTCPPVAPSALAHTFYLSTSPAASALFARNFTPPTFLSSITEDLIEEEEEEEPEAQERADVLEAHFQNVPHQKPTAEAHPSRGAHTCGQQQNGDVPIVRAYESEITLDESTMLHDSTLTYVSEGDDSLWQQDATLSPHVLNTTCPLPGRRIPTAQGSTTQAKSQLESEPKPHLLSQLQSQRIVKGDQGQQEQILDADATEAISSAQQAAPDTPHRSVDSVDSAADSELSAVSAFGSRDSTGSSSLFDLTTREAQQQAQHDTADGQPCESVDTDAQGRNSQPMTWLMNRVAKIDARVTVKHDDDDGEDVQPVQNQQQQQGHAATTQITSTLSKKDCASLTDHTAAAFGEDALALAAQLTSSRPESRKDGRTACVCQEQDVSVLSAGTTARCDRYQDMFNAFDYIMSSLGASSYTSQQDQEAPHARVNTGKDDGTSSLFLRCSGHKEPPRRSVRRGDNGSQLQKSASYHGATPGSLSSSNASVAVQSEGTTNTASSHENMPPTQLETRKQTQLKRSPSRYSSRLKSRPLPALTEAVLADMSESPHTPNTRSWSRVAGEVSVLEQHCVDVSSHMSSPVRAVVCYMGTKEAHKGSLGVDVVARTGDETGLFARERGVVLASTVEIKPQPQQSGTSLLREGDRIVAVNGRSLLRMSNAVAFGYLSNALAHETEPLKVTVWRMTNAQLPRRHTMSDMSTPIHSGVSSALQSRGSTPSIRDNSTAYSWEYETYNSALITEIV
eukprot:m.71605 g.71605  ORF g.71605 m.71605 type:complete len:2159 (-) comp12305_c0_seq1:387-6863(-)